MTSPGPAAPSARHQVLALLRDRSGPRPSFDPGLAGGLRAWLEDAASEVVLRRGEETPPLLLGPGDWTAEPVPGDGRDSLSTDRVTSHLVRVLFRQIVTTGSVRDPLSDAVDGLRVDPWHRTLLAHVEGLSGGARATLNRSLATHVRHLLAVTPHFAPGWLPRTNDRLAIPLAGGRVVLCGTFDLLVGAAEPGTATLCAVGLSTGGPWAEARRSLQYAATLEALRSGSPPFRLAVLESTTGRYSIEDVVEEHLRSQVSLLVDRLSRWGSRHV